ncbi:MAG: class I SAM-dependent methyltransferase [bacterium]|nr:class I SAM-dependent methyltransferase [bacterium]
MKWYQEFYGGEFDPVVGFPDDETTARQAAFVVEVLGLSAGDSLLDLACGYGRHSLLFMEQGFEVTGLDLSEYYIEKAREKAAVAGIRAEFIVADMREIPYSDAFDAAVSMFTSFGFFETRDEDMRVLTGAARALKAKGKLLIDYENPFNFVSNRIEKNRFSEFKLGDGTVAAVEHDFDVLRQREKMTARIRRPDGSEHESGYDIRLYSPPEMEAMLAEAGFTVREWFGDFGGGAPAPESPRLVVVAEKK